MIESESLRITCLRILDRMGIIRIVEWDEYDRSHSIFVKHMDIVLDPKWLTKLLASVVTFRHGFVKSGVLEKKDLIALWRREVSEDEDLQQIMLQYLTNLDVIQPLDADRLLVPCTLPDTGPEIFSVVNKRTIRRCFLLGERVLPVEVMGRILCVAMKIGTCTSASLGACCVVTPKGIRLSIRKEEITQVKGERVEKSDAVVLLVDSDSRHGDVLLRKLVGCISDVLKNFYHLSYRLVIPVDDSCSDWWEMTEVFASLHDKNAILRSVRRGVGKNLLHLCPDLNEKRGGVKTIEYNDLKLLDKVSDETGKAVHAIWFDGKGKVNLVIRNWWLQTLPMESIFDSIREAALVHGMSHPNIVPLRGICVTSSAFWIIYSQGGYSLFSQLMDPIGLNSQMEQFQRKFGQNYVKHKEKEMSQVLKEEIALLRELGQKLSQMGFDPLRKMMLSYLEASEQHWKERTRDSHRVADLRLMEVGEIFFFFL